MGQGTSMLGTLKGFTFAIVSVLLTLFPALVTAQTNTSKFNLEEAPAIEKELKELERYHNNCIVALIRADGYARSLDVALFGAALTDARFNVEMTRLVEVSMINEDVRLNHPIVPLQLSRIKRAGKTPQQFVKEMGPIIKEKVKTLKEKQISLKQICEKPAS